MSMAERYAREHRRFLEENRPDVFAGLRQSGDLNSYLSSTGQQAAEMFAHLMAQYQNSPEVRDLPYVVKVQASESRRMEVEEVVRHDLILRPAPD